MNTVVNIMKIDDPLGSTLHASRDWSNAQWPSSPSLSTQDLPLDSLPSPGIERRSNRQRTEVKFNLGRKINYA